MEKGEIYMKTLLAPIYEAVAKGFDTMLIGNTITVIIDSDRRVEIRFYDMKTHQCYDSLYLTVKCDMFAWTR